MNGVIRKWDLERGFGWLASPNGRNYFCHITNWLEDVPPVVGRAVEFELGPGVNGKPQQAINARYAIDAGVNALASGSAE